MGHVIEFLSHCNDVEESCNFENLLHAKWSNFDNTQKNPPGMLGEDFFRSGHPNVRLPRL